MQNKQERALIIFSSVIAAIVAGATAGYLEYQSHLNAAGAKAPAQAPTEFSTLQPMEVDATEIPEAEKAAN